MKIKRVKLNLIIILCGLFIAAIIAAGCVLGGVTAYADEGAGYNESYRNRLAFSAARGWNNDPNGLLYVPDPSGDGGTYHMYYQYNWNKNGNGGSGETANVHGRISWGHATSRDLVHWEEKPVAIPAIPTGEYDGEGKEIYDMMFSGSAVYDEHDTSGLFDGGSGIVAILTQPKDSAGGQRQILAYSKDNGQSFEIYGEILGANAEGSLGDNEFRDPKVFRSEKLNKWLMAVGGGAVRMYSSDDLKNWSYLGQTGYWGECPDISRYQVDGEEKYVLIISPEDKAKSHEFNGTTRAETYYPAEYYVVGELNESGLFVSNEPVKRLSEGIDSYAFQSFNNVPDGKVYGVSWSASWKTVGEYERYRKNYNGGMTVVCELKLIKENDGYVLTRTPVEAYDGLRKDTLKEYNDKLGAGSNALAGVRADVAEIEAELDFTGSNATYAELNMRVSAAEKITLRYDVASQLLTLDRSKSSLLAENTALYAVPYNKTVQTAEGKLSLKVVLDRAFISVFANGGRASFFSAVFPSAISNGMQLVSDGDIGVNAKVYSLNGIFNAADSVDELILTTDKIDATVGSSYSVIASSYSKNFNAEDVTFGVKEGSGNVKLEYSGGTAVISALKSGSAKIEAVYGTEEREISVYIYNYGFESNVDYGLRLGGFSFIADDGMRFDTGKSDAFLFSETEGESFIYSAEFTVKESGSQAGGLVFGVSGNLTDYWVATADIKDNKIKLWRSGIGDLKSVDYGFGNPPSVKLTLTVNGGVAKIYVNGDKTAALVQSLSGYAGGKIGLNVYNAKMAVSNVLFNEIVAEDNEINIVGYPVIKVVNVTDGSRRLQNGDYAYSGGKLTVSPAYLSTLENDTEYTFRVYTALTDFDVTLKTDFAPSALYLSKEEYSRADSLTFGVSDGAEVYGVEIDGKRYDFKRDGELITVEAGNLSEFMTGTHVVKAYTSKGRPQAEFSVVTENDFRNEDIEEISYTFLYIDMAIFAAAGVGFAVISIILKRRAK